MAKSEKEHAQEMNDKGFRDGSRGASPPLFVPSDRTYGDYVRDARNYREGFAAGESARKNSK
jgi:hypothetical protein